MLWWKVAVDGVGAEPLGEPQKELEAWREACTEIKMGFGEEVL